MDLLLSYAIERRISKAPEQGPVLLPFLWSLLTTILLRLHLCSYICVTTLNNDHVIRGPACKAPTLQAPRAGQTRHHIFAAVHHRLPWLQRGLHDQRRERRVWDCGAPQTLSRSPYPAQPRDVWSGVLLRCWGSLCDSGAAERGPSSQSVQSRVVDQPHPRFPTATCYRLGQRLLSLPLGAAEALHPGPWHHDADRDKHVPQWRCFRFRWEMVMSGTFEFFSRVKMEFLITSPHNWAIWNLPFSLMLPVNQSQ